MAGDNVVASCKAPMEREKIPRDELLEILLTEIAGTIGDANFLRHRIEINRSDGNPNWDASLRGSFGEPVLNAFLEARSTARALYDVDWPENGRR